MQGETRSSAALRDSTDLRPRHAVVQAVYGGIQELAGFDRPEWFDL
jgi:hypothetical protein